MPVSPEEDVYAVDVAAVQSDRVSGLGSGVLETEEVVGHLWRAGHLTGAVQTKDQQIHHQAVVLHDERSKLQTSDDAVRVGVIHVLEDRRLFTSTTDNDAFLFNIKRRTYFVVDDHVVLGRHVISDVVVNNKAQ